MIVILSPQKEKPVLSPPSSRVKNRSRRDVVTRGTFGGDKTKVLRRGVVSPRVRSPLPAYSAKEKKLSKLRAQMTALKKERDKLIQEMKAKNFDTGSLFLQ
jgi:hypothetical protein